MAFENAKFHIMREVTLTPDRKQWELHYKEHEGKDFYERLITAMQDKPVIVMLVQAPPSIEPSSARVICHHLRQLYSQGNPNNTVHVSDSVEAGIRERILWFKDEAR